jgi:hypothetical protein
MTTTAVPDVLVRTRRRSAVLPAVAGLLGLAAFATAVVFFNDPLRGASTPEDAASALEGSSITFAATMLAVYALLAVGITGRLAERLAAASGEHASTRLIPLLGAGHVLLLAGAFAAPAAAVTVGSSVFSGGITPEGAETALILMNVAHPLSAWLGVAFLIAVAVAARSSRVLMTISIVFAVGLALPPVGWAVTYLMPFWFAGVGIWLWRRA